LGADEVFATHTAPKASEQRRTGQSPHKYQLVILPDVADTDDLDASTPVAAQEKDLAMKMEGYYNPYEQIDKFC
jgi:hypothetical protein